MNIALWIVILLIFVIGITGLVYQGATFEEVQREINFSNVPCLGPLTDYPDIDEFPFRFTTCMTYTNRVDTQRFYDIDNDWTILPFPQGTMPSAQAVCSGICGQIQLPVECLAGTPAYDDCMDSLLPVACNDPANPVARRKTTYYYVQGKGKISCF